MTTVWLHPVFVLQTFYIKQTVEVIIHLFDLQNALITLASGHIYNSDANLINTTLLGSSQAGGVPHLPLAATMIRRANLNRWIM